MLPDFTELKTILENRNLGILNEEVKKSRANTILSELIFYRLFEGNRASFLDMDGKLLEVPYEIKGIDFSIKKGDIVQKGHRAYKEKLSKIAKDIVNVEEKSLLKELSTTAKKAGMVVNAKGKSIENVILESFEKTDLTFDEYGNHNGILIIPPNLMGKLKNKASNVFKGKLEEIIEKKRRKWLDRERNRKLVE